MPVGGNASSIRRNFTRVNVELDRVNNDLVNLQISAKLTIVLLGRGQTIRRYSPQAEKQFDLLAAESRLRSCRT